MQHPDNGQCAGPARDKVPVGEEIEEDEERDEPDGAAEIEQAGRGGMGRRQRTHRRVGAGADQEEHERGEEGQWLPLRAPEEDASNEAEPRREGHVEREGVGGVGGDGKAEAGQTVPHSLVGGAELPVAGGEGGDKEPERDHGDREPREPRDEQGASVQPRGGFALRGGGRRRHRPCRHPRPPDRSLTWPGRFTC
ncbi:MAG: hypothetical protein M3Q71_07680 [Chloroflexota bacterium]|nr:hypothetical protein [Chloroflexota bacterium]